VIVPSFTFVATPHALEWLGVTPVFCDVEPGSYTLDPDLVERLITPRTSAIIGVHVWGRPCRIEPLQEIADRHRLPLLFDAAQAFGSAYEGVPVGRFGTAEILSFHATKVINSIEGGALVTDDDDLADRVRHMRSYGFVDVDRVVSVGTNAKMNEISAAMGIASLEAFDQIVERNRANYQAYSDGLEGLEGVALADFDPDQQRGHHYVVAEIDEAGAGLSRDRVRDLLEAENVLARRYFYPGCHRLEPYRTRPGEMVYALPVTDGIAARALCLPTGQSVDGQTIGQLCALIRFGVEHSDEIEQRLAAGEPGGR
jgi:dTDP-4-amino-4,6-dideoxygalactose transaminase